MSTRLAKGGRLLDRSKPLNFTFNGTPLRGFLGDTLASALLGSGKTLLGRSFKYHRPRGLVASGVEEPNVLVNLGRNARLEPDQRATTTELFEGAEAASQNHWPSLEFDIGEINDKISKLFPAGFYYKTFMAPKWAWKHLFEPVIRQAAGLGAAPKEADPDRYEQTYAFCDVLVAGGGVAGLAAALAEAKAGKRVMVMEQTAFWGGRAPVDGGTIDGLAPDEWVRNAIEALEKMENVQLFTRTMVSGLYNHGYVIGYQRVADHTPGDGRPRHRLWRIRAGLVITATGALERPLAFAGNDVPGVMLASAVRDYLVNWAVSPGDRVVIVTNNDDAYRTALAVLDAGLSVPVVIDARDSVTGALPMAVKARGVRVLEGRGVAKVLGRKAVTGVEICAQAGEGGVIETVACDCVAMSGGWSPVVHLFSHVGGKLIWDEAGAMFRPDATRPPIKADGTALARAVGAANGALTLDALCAEAGLAAQVEPEAPLAPVWVMPAGAKEALKFKAFLDYQNDVKVSDVQLAAREGYTSVEHTKRYTTLGMASDQGKLSNINGLAILSDALGQAIPQTGTTTFRPPYTPISFGAVAAEAKGEIFQPLRRTPMHGWHEAKGAHWEPVGLWRRPYCYPRSGESHRDAVNREITNTRTNVGLLDASTLGKIVVKGPDAGRFLDMLYTGMMSTLPVGKCRYGIMCNENGFLMDDGVVVRLSEDSWLCHTTSGGAEHIHAWMEDWLQCEWWDWKVYTANLTEQYAQVAVVGPKARAVLEKLGGMDVSKEALPFMSLAEGTLGGFPARVFRISFSGELSYEIAVPANMGLAFWEALNAAGAEFGAMPYGTEALHVMRAEKGFIMIGDETDGTVIPQDLNLGWAISKKKDDYLGKRAQARVEMARPDRWRLVGLETIDGTVLPDGVYAVAEGHNANGQRNTQGRVTSTYWSPTLKKGIAMGLVVNGPERMGEVLDFPGDGGGVHKVKIVDPCFYDKEGEKANV
ncbi:sarcosine oxidase subunit alpha family protein [Paenirhodobacter hankyongi]|uniref:Sarcosine oxidase subunit alpha family protein n=1 Tax=Paenirhodobacter hankyongi TaxID=2294033 RepID=A0A421BU64_9RHOB|nr:sarcosine oxidase subunit alpha family protein [Sinirhodobacter hankyongi]RLL71846.1 sarcosine oxidase subunit alpha family protein [Sinirhodobacter hankyongi]